MSGPFFNVSTALKGTQLYIVFVVTAAGVMPRGSPKKVTPYIVQSAVYILLMVL